MSDIEARRAANRAAFPEVSQIVDEFRAAFGEGVKVLGGSEGGRSFGVQHDHSACDGCNGRVCDRIDQASVFCGYKWAEHINQQHPMAVYQKHGMGMRR